MAQDLGALGLPAITSSLDSSGGTTYSLSLQILLLMTALTVLPSLVLGMTAFTRIIIVLSILRQALGTQQTPPNQVLIAIALFLSFYIMSPIFEILYAETITPYLDGKLSAEIAISQGLSLLKEFMVSNTRVDTLNMFAELSGEGPFESKDSIPLSIVLPSFITSELKTAFEIGFLIISSTVKMSDKTCVGCDDGLKPLIIGIDKYFLKSSTFLSLSVLNINPSP